MPGASNRVQAEVPRGATVLSNRWGTAPGIWLEGARGLVVMLPVDYLFWTSRVAMVAQALTAKMPSRPRIAQRELWIAGNVSPRARQEFEALGWTVYEQVSAKLNPPA